MMIARTGSPATFAFVARTDVIGTGPVGGRRTRPDRGIRARARQHGNPHPCRGIPRGRSGVVRHQRRGA
ncbi:hypothetical protein [Rhodococcus sp. ARP2]|uniref:hypothetical protein n=1 Tax=Rhodococcus sp. ARP2 TaxID=1661385 RepID=UPI0021D533CE|nr:hypothetical protein [Rhodococcus sp. ARP2]